MKQILLLFSVLVLFVAHSCSSNDNPSPEYPWHPNYLDLLAKSERPIMIAEQSQNMVAIVDSTTNNEIWSWKVALSSIPTDKQPLYNNIDEVKAVYNKKYVLITASTGGAAVVRIADKKVMFYAFPMGNPHSMEVLPDGNIVIATSTGNDDTANSILVYKMDTLATVPATIHSRVDVYSGHNVVWDIKTKRLLATASNKLKFFSYNHDASNPQLALEDEISLPEGGAHDMFPVYGEYALWLTTSNHIYKLDLTTKTFVEASFSDKEIKSVTSGPSKWGTLLVKPTQSHWTPYVTNHEGKRILNVANGRIYKARWYLDNPFSYPENHEFLQP